MKPPVRIADLIGTCVTRTSLKLIASLQAIDPLFTGVHYLYGHYTDVKERLIEYGKTDKQDKYPLVVFFEDYRVKVEKPGIFGIADAKLIIVTPTQAPITRAQREANFTQILIPIYDELFRQMKRSGFFMQYGPFPHNRIDRPHWGDPAIYGNKGYLFNDILDGIEITDLQLQTYFNNCVTA